MMTNFSLKYYKYIFYLIIISLSISPAIVTSQEDSRNFFLIGCMGLGPFFYLISTRKLFKIDRVILLFSLLLIIIPVLFNYGSIKWSSLFFTLMFLIYFLSGFHCAIRGKIEFGDIAKVCRLLILSYLIVLIIQQFCVLVSLPVFNGNQVNPLEPWKLNSLSAEPSHTSRYVGILMFAYVFCCRSMHKLNYSFIASVKADKLIWFAFGWIMLTTVSGTGIIVFALIMTLFLTKKNILLFVLLFGLIGIVGVTSEITALKRSVVFLNAVITGNTDLMIDADHSASIRVAPWIWCIERLNPLSLRSWIGEGTGSTSLWMYTYMPGVPRGWTGGGIANMMVEYGLILGLYYLIFSYKCCSIRKYRICSIGLWIMCVVLLGINMQMSWLCILTMYILNYLSSCHENKSLL